MFLLETTVPTATDPLLGGESLIFSPGFAVIVDMPAMGFFASMNFFDSDVWRDNSRGNISRYRGRWFYMQPLTPPGFMAAKDPEIPDFGVLSGLYLLPEVQPVYDFETDLFSLWIAPEVGKVVTEGQILYANALPIARGERVALRRAARPWRRHAVPALQGGRLQSGGA